MGKAQLMKQITDDMECLPLSFWKNKSLEWNIQKKLNRDYRTLN
jgi:hypothetical protein